MPYFSNIKRVSILIATTSTLLACNSSTAISASETLSGKWLIESIQSQYVINKGSVTLIFNADQQLSGSASCNNISSSYKLQNSSLTIAPIASTRKVCLPAIMEQESDLLQALSKVRRFQLHNDQLSMYDQQGALQIKAKRYKPLESMR